MEQDEMAQQLLQLLDEGRYRHTLGVAKTAEELAERFGEDPEKARLAGMLHDCAKCLPTQQMQRTAACLQLSEEVMNSRALLHAPAGMCLARDRFGVKDPAVLGAIRWHTTGRSGMTQLEKIVYLADMIEPNRPAYPGLDALRRVCASNLEMAMHMALRMSTNHVLSRGKTLHPDTIAALRDYEGEPNQDGRIRGMEESVQ